MLDKYEQDYANNSEFIAEGLAIKLTEEMLELLEQKGLNQSWLAEQMGVSREHVSRILNARPNMTLLTIAKIAVALGVKPEVSLDKTFSVGEVKRSPRKQFAAKPISVS
jgi:plasmid maintenance system antidote protein VapI